MHEALRARDGVDGAGVDAARAADAARFIDQGGIAETSRPTSHSDPVYVAEGVVHYCVPNMPAAVARTASLALERAVLPYLNDLAVNGKSPEIKTGIQVHAGNVTHEFLARDTGRPYHPL